MNLTEHPPLIRGGPGRGWPKLCAAEEKLAELTRAPHKQTYWIEERTEGGVT